MTDLSSNAELVRRLLSDTPVLGAEPDLGALSDSELGSLAGLAWASQTSQLHHRLRAVLRERSPAFSPATAVAALQSLESSARHLEQQSPALATWIMEAAAQVVYGCSEETGARIQSALRSLLEQSVLPHPSLLATALRSFAGLPVPRPESELARSEQRFLCALESVRDRIVMGRIRSEWHYGMDDAELTPRGADPLALLPGYLDFAEQLTDSALERVQAIQSGAVPYLADKALGVNDAYALHAALRAGLDQNAPWAEHATASLLAGFSVAPVETAKTVPSQSAAIAIAKAIAERPSGALVADMKTLLRNVRHAGLKKKLDRFRVVAERRMFEHPDFLLDLRPDTEVPRSLSGALTRAFEALFLRSSAVPFEAWMRLLANKAAAERATRLVWRSESGTSFVPVRTGKVWSFVASDGTPQPVPSGPIALWHPLQPNSEADAWRAWVLGPEIRQPFNQLFRETYSSSSLPELLAPDLDVKTLLGLAQSQGWRLSGGRLIRTLGPYRVELDVGRVFPGATGTTRCTSIDFFERTGSRSLDLALQTPQSVSECLRAVDLLVSVSAFALTPTSPRESTSARERRSVLASLLGTDPQANGPFVAERHVRAGSLSISIATGRASRNGEEVKPAPIASKVQVLPYPDEILIRIVTHLNASQPSNN